MDEADGTRAGASGRRRTMAMRRVFDALLAACAVLVMATALVQQAPHEWLGIALVVLVIVHLVLGRRFFATLFDGRRNTLRTVRFAVIIAMAVCIDCAAVSGCLMSRHALAALPQLPGVAAGARMVHMVSNHWAFVLMFVHAGLQFRLPGCARKRLSGLAAPAKWALRVALVAVACIGIWSCVQLDLFPKMFGQVAFAFVDFGAPIIVPVLQWASVGFLAAAAAYFASTGLGRREPRA